MRVESSARGRVASAVASVIAAALVAQGCSSLFGLGGPEVSLRFDVVEEVGTDLELEIDIGGRRFRLEPREAVDDHAPRSGDLSVSVRLLAGTGEVLATDAFRQWFGDDSDQWVHGRIGGPRPLGFCFGALSVLPVGPPVADTLFVTHGGIPKDAVC